MVRIKGKSYLHSLATDHGVPLGVNPGGKGTDTATPIELRNRIIKKVFTTNSNPDGISQLDEDGWPVGNRRLGLPIQEGSRPLSKDFIGPGESFPIEDQAGTVDAAGPPFVGKASDDRKP